MDGSRRHPAGDRRRAPRQDFCPCYQDWRQAVPASTIFYAKTRTGFKEQLDLAATGGINIHITGSLPRQKMLTDEPEDGK